MNNNKKRVHGSRNLLAQSKLAQEKRLLQVDQRNLNSITLLLGTSAKIIGCPSFATYANSYQLQTNLRFATTTTRQLSSKEIGESI
ncbi:hypothetical protein FGO68_gene8517 [Halteria grandinella]|uniref:Uncharacterized protein n=1 Tax=Halteria grandinella TaxID=5974 RepID=A0A8J8NXW2_HALGN|nr:hypothetical protein FGO68_gene8517 [Halteria grandinella]